MNRHNSIRGAFAPLGFVILLATLSVSLAGVPAARAEEAVGRGVRTLILVRHGIYDDADPRDPDVGKALIPMGREQARLTGRRLAAMPVAIDALHASTMTRARQTAEIIAASLKGRSPRPSRDIRECTPPTEREDIMRDEEAGAPEECRQTLERAFAGFFRPSPARDSTEVLVCHGNVIRYFVARALGLDPMRWLRMTIANCSLTVIRVRADGTMQLVSFGDMGHLPPRIQTFPGQRAAAADSARKR